MEVKSLFKGSTPSKLQIALAFLSIYIIWGSTYLAIRFAIDTIPPLMMAGARFLLAGIPLYCILRLTGSARPTLAEWKVSALLGVLLLSVGTGGVVLSEQSVPSGLVSLLVAMVPVYVAILEWLISAFKNGTARPNLFSVSGLAVSTIGIFLLVAPSLGSGMGGKALNFMGIALVMLSSFSWSLGTVISRRLTMPRSTMLGTAMQMIFGGAFLMLGSFGFGEHKGLDLHAISLNSLLAFAYLTVFGSIAAFSAYIWLLKHLSPEKVSTYAYVNPVVAVLLGWVILGEPVSATTALAGVTILGGVALLSVGNSQEYFKSAAYKKAIVKTGQFLRLR